MDGARTTETSRAAGVGAALVAALALVACSQRERIAFGEPPPPGPGPETVIDFPTGDTTVAAGPGFVVTGYSHSPDGVDTLYFETAGGVSQFPPLVDGSDSVRFGLPLTTLNQSGQRITVRVFGVDGLGRRGDTAERVVTVR
jgi:hypothetical protein